MRGTLSLPLAADVLSCSRLAVSVAAAAVALEAGTPSGDMGGGRRMPAGRAPTLPRITVRFTVP